LNSPSTAPLLLGAADAQEAATNRCSDRAVLRQLSVRGLRKRQAPPDRRHTPTTV